jgi:homoserine/homoserine lactone efflux protein
MTLKTWLLFLIMETSLSLSPGPAVFYVVSQGVRAFRRCVPATLGILTANAIYFALSATSLGALIAASARFFTLAKWLGAVYLAYLGIKSLRAAARIPAVPLTAAPAPPAQAPMATGERRQIFTGALALQSSNPKALLFFLALLPQFIDTHRAVGPQMAVLAATSMLPEFCILLCYGWLAHRAAHASARFGVARAMNRCLAWIEGFGLLGCATLVLKFGRAA